MRIRSISLALVAAAAFCSSTGPIRANDGHDHDDHDDRGLTVQLGPRPFYLVEGMDEGRSDPSFDLPETETFDERTLPGFDGYNAFLAALLEETKAFVGQVALVHGDTHFFKVDKPLVNQVNLVANFTRVETFGSPNIHWVKVTVDPRSRNLFTFEPMIVPGN